MDAIYSLKIILKDVISSNLYNLYAYGSFCEGCWDSFKEFYRVRQYKSKYLKKAYIIFFKCDNTPRKIDVKKDEWVLLYNSLYSEVRYCGLTSLHSTSLSLTHILTYTLSLSLSLSLPSTLLPPCSRYSMSLW